MPFLTTPITETLHVNDGLLESDQLGQLRPSNPNEDIAELRRRYTEDGYLFLKALLPREDVLKARSEYFTSLAPSGVLAPGTDPVSGIFDSAKDPVDFPGIGAGSSSKNGRPVGGDLFVDLALNAHYEDWYTETFSKHPALSSFVAKFTGWVDDTLLFRRSLLRNNVPNTHAIGVHYDQIFLRHGDVTNLTAWCPIGDISLQGGGLIYLESGQGVGAQVEKDFFEKAKASGFTDEEAKNAFNSNMMETGLLADGPAEFGKQYGRRWLASAYEAGDVVLHPPFAIHASTRNNDPNNVIRLATDLRFCDSSRPYDKRWCNFYRAGDGV